MTALRSELQAQFKEFQADPRKLPDSKRMHLAATEHLRVVTDAANTCNAAYDAAIAWHRARKEISEIETLQSEKDKYHLGAMAPVASFKKNSIWTVQKTTGSGVASKQIEITEVRLNKFEGRLILADSRKFRITGEINGGKLTFATDSTPGTHLHRKFDGQIADGVLKATWVGIGAKGDRMNGDVELKLKK
jgi:hypothetical protein